MKGVLIVDDEPSILDSISDLLTWAGYSVTTAVNGEQGLELAALVKPHLILLDFMMPGMDGLTMLRKLRAQPHLAALPVVMMSAVPGSLPDDDRPWDAFLAKPFDIHLLLQTVRGFIGAP